MNRRITILIPTLKSSSSVLLLDNNLVACITSIHITLLIIQSSFWLVSVYSPTIWVESHTRKVPSDVSRSLSSTSHLLGGEMA